VNYFKTAAIAIALAVMFTLIHLFVNAAISGGGSRNRIIGMGAILFWTIYSPLYWLLLVTVVGGYIYWAVKR
jgi:hypothetical protein